jgi:hypothetical protein
MATLTQFRAEMAAVLGLDNAVAGDQTYMDAFINEAVADVMVKTHCKVLPFEMSTTAGEGDYTLSTEVLAFIELSITSSSSDYALERVAPAEILRLRRNSESTSSPSLSYAVSGANMLMLYPTPDAVDTITGIYVPRPATLAAGGDTPSSIPSEWHRLVSYYALFRGADMDDDASSEMGERYRALYENGIREMRRAVYQHGGARMAPIRVNPRRHQLVPHDPSVSW